MRVTELLTKDTIAMDLMANDKNGVIDELVNQLDKAGKLSDVASFKEAIHNRESQSTTGIGEGIAIPHAKVAAVKSPAIAFGKSKAGVDYQSLDMQPAHLFFMIAASEGGAQTHLDALAKLSGILMDENVREKLLHASSPEEVLAIIDHADDEATKEEEAEAEAQQVAAAEQSSKQSNEPYVLAVTACPTGIAHTYMARDALKKQADKMGIKIKVETNGSSGIKNHLTEQDIENATGIIVAADVHVETDRFDGKNVVEVPVADGIKRPEELINKALDTSRKPFVARDGNRKGHSNDNQEKLSPGKAFYKHLMNGVSNMLPLVISGGILMAIVFLFGANSFDPKSSDYNAFAEQLWNIGSKSAFALIIPILSGFIARSIADKPGFASGLVGGMLAISGGSGFIGGMIPPLAIATAMLIFRRKFTKEQRGSIIPNYVMGMSFITEGAIPFAAADPLRVIPSMMIGSGIGGAIALGLGSRITAPHGGIIVIVGTDGAHLLQTLIALVVGTLVSALIYGLIKPKLTETEIEASKSMDE